VNNLLGEGPVLTIGIFSDICRKSRDRDFGGRYHGSQFMVDPYFLQDKVPRIAGDEWTWDILGPIPLRCCVQMKAGITEETFKRFVLTLPDGGVREELTVAPPNDLHGLTWVVGLTCDEKEVLLLHPLVGDVKPYRPRFDMMSRAFD
jgi:hypothetical protein